MDDGVIVEVVALEIGIWMFFITFKSEMQKCSPAKFGAFIHMVWDCLWVYHLLELGP